MKMEFIKTPLEGLYIIKHNVLQDDRGLFTRTFCKEEFKSIGFEKDFLQFNHSFNVKKGTIRGLHYQLKPCTETKLIRCVQGAVYDVAVDIRQGSTTFLQYFGIELSSTNFLSILIPDGFAHGFQTLEDNSALIYHHTQKYTPIADAGLRYDDDMIKINWPLPPVNVSNKDYSYTLLDYQFKGLII